MTKLPEGFHKAALAMHVASDRATTLIGISHTLYYHGDRLTTGLTTEIVETYVHDMRKAVDDLHEKLEALEDTLVVNEREQAQEQYWARVDEGRAMAKDREIDR